MNPVPIKPLISTSDLDKIDVRVGTILAVEDVAHSEKLVRLRVDFGDLEKVRSQFLSLRQRHPHPDFSVNGWAEYLPIKRGFSRVATAPEIAELRHLRLGDGISLHFFTVAPLRSSAMSSLSDRRSWLRENASRATSSSTPHPQS